MEIGTAKLQSSYCLFIYHYTLEMFAQNFYKVEGCRVEHVPTQNTIYLELDPYIFLIDHFTKPNQIFLYLNHIFHKVIHWIVYIRDLGTFLFFY